MQLQEIIEFLSTFYPVSPSGNILQSCNTISQPGYWLWCSLDAVHFPYHNDPSCCPFVAKSTFLSPYPLLFFFFNKLINLFLAVLGLCCWCRLSLVTCGDWGLLFVWCAGFSLCWLFLLRSTGSRRAGFSSCGSQAQ